MLLKLYAIICFLLLIGIHQTKGLSQNLLKSLSAPPCQPEDGCYDSTIQNQNEGILLPPKDAVKISTNREGYQYPTPTPNKGYNYPPPTHNEGYNYPPPTPIYPVPPATQEAQKPQQTPGVAEK